MPRAGVDCVWSRTGGGEQVRVLPDACADVLWHRETGTLRLAGPDTTAQLTTSEPGTLVGIRFPTLHGPLGLPASAVRDARVPLADVWTPHRAKALADRLARTPDTRAAQLLLLAEFESTPDPLATALRALARRTGAVAEMAADLGYSPRQLRRHAHTTFGYGPKTLHRVLRFTAALDRARAGVPLAEVAQVTGYTDQAHLAKDVRALAGTTLTSLLRGGGRSGGAGAGSPG
ncbi:hypothetical protein BJP25_09680 [Actinokineospora bangkokensis]|uniref:HTH araC/xylS-type domain-containing protein n=1 Tax=Actinokineospora bangkokensis TaxID=1193682 RepID=A0A1Q9LSB9_9PSEU|nr:hypothetical protein BJP25_09680 [Actinokineospora bangkokensis]